MDSTRPKRSLMDTTSPASSPPRDITSHLNSSLLASPSVRRSSRVGSSNIDYSPYKQRSSRSRNPSNSVVNRAGSVMDHDTTSPIRKVKQSTRTRSRSRSRSRFVGPVLGVQSVSQVDSKPVESSWSSLVSDSRIVPSKMSDRVLLNKMSDGIASKISDSRLVTSLVGVKIWLVSSQRVRYVVSSLALLVLLLTVQLVWVHTELISGSLDKVRVVMMTAPELVTSISGILAQHQSAGDRKPLEFNSKDIKKIVETVTKEEMQQLQRSIETKFINDMQTLGKDLESRNEQFFEKRIQVDPAVSDDDGTSNRLSYLEKQLNNVLETVGKLSDTKQSLLNIDTKRFDTLEHAIKEINKDNIVMDVKNIIVKDVDVKVETFQDKFVNMEQSIASVNKRLIDIEERCSVLSEAMTHSQFLTQKDDILDQLKTQLNNVKSELTITSEIKMADMIKMSPSSCPKVSHQTTLVDWVSEVQGGRVTSFSPGYPGVTSRVLSVLGLTLWSRPQDPSDLIRPGPVGCAWTWAGQSANISFQLTNQILATSVSLEYPLHLSSITAPRSVLLIDEDSSTILADMTYRVDIQQNIQQFQLSQPIIIQKFQLKIVDNHGHEEITCLQRISVYGSLVDKVDVSTIITESVIGDI